IHAVVLGSAINNDGGDKVSFSAPSMSGQERVLRETLHRAGVAAESIGYVESHGTGTHLGDPIEFTALRRVFELATSKRGFCGLGSVKANVGHLDSCAGMAGLVKVIQMLQRGQLPPQAGFSSPNPALSIADSPFFIPL